jgi:hypothetical protein
MAEAEELDGIIPSPQLIRTSPSKAQTDDRLEFPGKCEDKTGISANGFSSEYKEFLAKSFETQTYVYEQAVRPLHSTPPNSLYQAR